MREVNYFTTEIRPKYKTERDIISLMFCRRDTRKDRKKNAARNASIKCILCTEYI